VIESIVLQLLLLAFLGSNDVVIALFDLLSELWGRSVGSFEM